MKIIYILFFITFSHFCTNAVFASKKISPIIAQYFGVWIEKGQQWEQKFRSDTPFKKLNRLYIAFGKIIKKSDGHFTVDIDGPPDHAEMVIKRVHELNPTAELFLVVGGTGDDGSYGGAANDDLFAENVRRFLIKHGFSGFDIDWEMTIKREKLNKLVTHLYSTLHAQGLKLTLDVWPYTSRVYDINILKDNLDQINIMSYGTGLNLENCVNSYEQAGFPIYKMIGGIETERDYNQFGGVADTFGPNGTIVIKSEYAMKRHLAGMMSWRLDNDHTTVENPNYPTYAGATALWNAMMKYPIFE